MEEDPKAVVIDNGTGTIKAGFSGDDAPRAVFSTIVGRPKVPGIMCGIDQKHVFMGEEAKQKKEILNLACPVEYGFVKDWDDMEKVWHHTLYSELRVSPEEHPVLMTESSLNPKSEREKLTEVMFETFNVPYFYSHVQSVLALLASGRTTGVVLDSGEAVSHMVPIFEGYAIPHATLKVKLGGSDLTNYMRKILKERGHTFNIHTESHIVQDIKETMSYIVADFAGGLKESEESHACEMNYEMPDGRKILVGNERFRCPEVVFQPRLCGKGDLKGFHEYLMDSIMKTQEDVQREMYTNIVLSGGNTLFDGLAGRLWNEVDLMKPASATIHIDQQPARKYSVWLGGSILASLSTFASQWINRAEYSEVGPAIVHRKCLI